MATSRLSSQSPSLRPQYYSPRLYAQPEERLSEQLLQDLSLAESPLHLDNLDDDSEDDNKTSENEGQEIDEGAVWIEGVPKSHVKLDARRYTTNAFSNQVLSLFSTDLHLDGWTDLPEGVAGSHLKIHRVSGALTNAVFFISCPSVAPEPPTVLLRVYGPCSGSLVSRRQELHLLHILSSLYGIGPAVLGTFENGRVEQYFRSRTLDKEELRDPRIIKWIGRRMKELHGVPHDQLKPPSIQSSASASSLARPVYSTRNSSTSSLHSESSVSSAFSFGSTYSSGSAASSRSSSFAKSLQPTTFTDISRFSESTAPPKRRSRPSMRSDSSSSIVKSRSKERLGIWDNITRWTRETAKIFKAIEKLRTLPGASNAPTGSEWLPMESPSALLAWKDQIDLPLFEDQVKAYRRHVSEWERLHGKSKRGLAHNDTQYGNLLVRTRPGLDKDTRAKDFKVEPDCEKAHEMLIVVDFEYAAWNPRGYDIANHFVEWQADYHHPKYSYSLERHLPYPTFEQRQIFYRAYQGLDDGIDNNDGRVPPAEEENARVLRLEEEVRLWQPATYAAWCHWSVVQARDEIVNKIEEWLAHPEAAERANEKLSSTPVKDPPRLVRNKSGDLVDLAKHGGEIVSDESVLDSAGPEAEFDYLLYGQEKMANFRRSLRELRVGVS